jgi:hypothetical protein
MNIICIKQLRELINIVLLQGDITGERAQDLIKALYDHDMKRLSELIEAVL